ncbi:MULTISPECIES: TrmH family RNA methyltransferase [Prauserella salsuginis group]|uniref:TrmH family RNA methyltransferase n=1 Tax=Prauserella salsuginis TaxID=387889 RepID=A0ABW6GA10_9PSEU|nr:MULTISPECIES: RNA methyltransferase [Prauserella salsuginis group]MCR3721373.1 23S rRNA (guanosine2251-2'-O)-methyltransferase [Prauserella flava]MCR3732364.1 23S rRNA (guanosine2251-2'-O)-methyltransferase [Prauserella salsuginis]
MTDPNAVSPKDRFFTVYGRKPVLEALTDPELEVDKVILADTARGAAASEIRRAATDAGVAVQHASAHRVKVLAGNGKQDQGVLADVVAPRMRPLAQALADRNPPSPLLVLDGITTPANVGMILRTATAAGLGGIVVPRRGVAALDPLVVKASAGVAFRAPVLRTGTALDAAEQLTDAGFAVYALGSTDSTSTDAAHGTGESLFDAELPARSAFVLGGETEGVDADVAGYVASWLSIPMPGDVESLNVSAAAAVLCFELVRRGNAG